jgi:predicted secreted protein
MLVGSTGMATFTPIATDELASTNVVSLDAERVKRATRQHWREPGY